MKKFIMILFIVALVIVAYETFRPQPPFPSDGTSAAISAPPAWAPTAAF
ncbi:MAG: hypothetical protein K6T30_04925 [Alicyclobacillus sp.]|nr:hypothetical protein [Alicyclobacillus sp.]